MRVIYTSMIWTAVVALAAIAARRFFAGKEWTASGRKFVNFGWIAATFVVVFFRTIFTGNHFHGYLLYRSYTSGWEAFLWTAVAVLAAAYWAEQFGFLPERSRPVVVSLAKSELLLAVLAPFDWVHGLWYLVAMVLVALVGYLWVQNPGVVNKVIGGALLGWAVIALIVILSQQHFWSGYGHDIRAFNRAFVGQSHHQDAGKEAPPKPGSTSVSGTTTDQKPAAVQAPPVSSTVNYLVTGSTKEPFLRVGCSDKSYCTSHDGNVWFTQVAQRMANLSGTPWQVQAFNSAGNSVGNTKYWPKPVTVKNTHTRQPGYNQKWCTTNDRLLGVSSGGKCVVGKL